MRGNWKSWIYANMDDPEHVNIEQGLYFTLGKDDWQFQDNMTKKLEEQPVFPSSMMPEVMRVGIALLEAAAKPGMDHAEIQDMGYVDLVPRYTVARYGYLTKKWIDEWKGGWV